MSLVLDAGALIAVERGDRDTAAVIEVARQEDRTVIVPASALKSAGCILVSSP